MERITEIVLEDRDGQWRCQVDWFAIMRPVRFEHDGRTFDASRQLEDGTLVYKTADKPKQAPKPRGVTVRLERGVARCFVTDLVVQPPLPDTIEYQDATYRKKGDSYWHG